MEPNTGDRRDDEADAESREVIAALRRLRDLVRDEARLPRDSPERERLAREIDALQHRAWSLASRLAGPAPRAPRRVRRHQSPGQAGRARPDERPGSSGQAGAADHRSA